MQSMEPARILCKGSVPAYRHGEKQRIEARIIGALPEEFAGRHDDAFLTD